MFTVFTGIKTFLLRTIPSKSKLVMSSSNNKRKRNAKESLPEAKQVKVNGENDSDVSLFSTVASERLTEASSAVNPKRLRLVTKTTDRAKEDALGGIIYWMSRDQRVQDNWAMLHAQELAMRWNTSLDVVVGFVPNKMNLLNRRMAAFQIEGLKEVEAECARLNIGWNLLLGSEDEMPDVVALIKRLDARAVVTDFSPLRHSLKWLETVASLLDEREVPMWQVDAHNIVPCWIASDRLEIGARTLRPKIHKHLAEYLKPFPPVVKHTRGDATAREKCDWAAIEKTLVESGIDSTVAPVDWAKGGAKAGFKALDRFIKKNLKFFAKDRNDPNKECTSDLSPWVNYGHLSMHRCILTVKPLKTKYSESVDSYIEEAVVRKELSDNFCFYQSKYDSLDGAANWARESLQLHAKDKRDYLYTEEQFEKAETYDYLWNAAQKQLVNEGRMHGFLRMYWAKKILEWASTPAEALRIAILFNDKFAIDGRCPNGYVGCMWSVVGTHDMGWKERPIFGKIRYMNYAGCKRKFDVAAFENKYFSGKQRKLSFEKKKK